MIGLFAAVESGDATKVEQLLAQLLPQNNKVSEMTDHRDRTALHLAVELGHEEVVEVLLGQSCGDIDLCAKDCAGFTALHLACELGHGKIVSRLLERSDDALKLQVENGASGSHGLTCLHLAVIRGHVKIVQLLLATMPALVLAEDSRTRSALYFAVEYGHEEVIEMLLEIAKSKKMYGEPMFHAAIRFGHEKIVRYFLDYRPQLIDVVSSDGLSPLSPLHLAAVNHQHSIVAELFTRRQPRFAEVGGQYDKSLLHFAVEYGYDTIVAELLAEQPHLVDILGEHGQTVLHVAIRDGHDKIVRQLLAHKPDLVETKDFQGWSALHFAVWNGNVTVMEQLLALKPELIDAKISGGGTALSLACRHAKPKALACLFAHGTLAVIEQDMFWELLIFGTDSLKVSETVRLLCAHKPELIEVVDLMNRNVLHHIFGFRRGDNLSFFSEELMRTVWQLSPPHLLRAIDDSDETPFHVAVSRNNKFAIELVQGKLSLDEIVEAYGERRPFHSLREQFSEHLLVPLNKDVADTVWEYLGVERPSNKRKREEDEPL